MPVHCEKREGKWRIVEPSGHIARTKNKKPRDGGGHASRSACEAQARAINQPK